MTKQIAIGFSVRERFSLTLASLKSIYQFTKIPFTLYFVNSNYPPDLQQEVLSFLADKDNVVFLNYDRFMLPNESLNKIIEQVKEPILCIVENDVLVEENYLEEMLAVLQEHQCEIVSPLIYQGYGRGLHYDPPLSTISKQDDYYISQVVRIPKQGYQKVAGTRKIFHIEKHCFLLTLKAAQAMYPFPAFLNTREHIDFSLRAYELGFTTFMAPKSKTRYISPPPIEPIDVEFFRFRWDLTQAKQSNDYVEKTWKILNFRRATTAEKMNKLLDKALTQTA
jgi:hypothetical protein